MNIRFNTNHLILFKKPKICKQVYTKEYKQQVAAINHSNEINNNSLERDNFTD